MFPNQFGGGHQPPFGGSFQGFWNPNPGAPRLDANWFFQQQQQQQYQQQQHILMGAPFQAQGQNMFDANRGMQAIPQNPINSGFVSRQNCQGMASLPQAQSSFSYSDVSSTDSPLIPPVPPERPVSPPPPPPVTNPEENQDSTISQETIERAKEILEGKKPIETPQSTVQAQSTSHSAESEWWICSSCQSDNFYVRKDCFKCHSPRPKLDAGQAPESERTKPPEPEISPSAKSNCSKTSDSSTSSKHPSQPRALSQKHKKRWTCHNCQRENWAEKTICFKCKRKRAESDVGEDSSNKGAHQVPPKRAESHDMEPSSSFRSSTSKFQRDCNQSVPSPRLGKSELPDRSNLGQRGQGTSNIAFQDPLKRETLSDREVAFEKMFSEWERNFEKWKMENASNPDKKYVQSHIRKMNELRNQMLTRKESLRKQRLAMMEQKQQQTYVSNSLGKGRNKNERNREENFTQRSRMNHQPSEQYKSSKKAGPISSFYDSNISSVPDPPLYDRSRDSDFDWSYSSGRHLPTDSKKSHGDDCHQKDDYYAKSHTDWNEPHSFRNTSFQREKSNWEEFDSPLFERRRNSSDIPGLGDMNDIKYSTEGNDRQASINSGSHMERPNDYEYSWMAESDSLYVKRNQLDANRMKRPYNEFEKAYDVPSKQSRVIDYSHGDQVQTGRNLKQPQSSQGPLALSDFGSSNPVSDSQSDRFSDQSPYPNRNRNNANAAGGQPLFPCVSPNLGTTSHAKMNTLPSKGPLLSSHPLLSERAPSKPMGIVTPIDDILEPPGRFLRPPKIVIIMRGLPGSGKSYLTKSIKAKESDLGSEAPRILSLDDYFECDGEYEYDSALEEEFRSSLLKSFKKQIDDGYFSFIIVDAIHNKTKHYEPLWSHAKQKGFEVYIAELECDVSVSVSRNVHGRSKDEIEELNRTWEPTPSHFNSLDLRSYLQDKEITDVDMTDDRPSNEKVEGKEEDSKHADEEEDAEEDTEGCFKVSKWEIMDKEFKMAQLDDVGVKAHKRKAQHESIEDWLELSASRDKPKDGKKRVRWADIEERKQQMRMREMGFVVGHTNWNRMMDSSEGESALTRTKIIPNRFENN